jgi:hypothetical protein
MKLNLDIVLSGTQEEFEEHLRLIHSTDEPHWDLKKWIDDQIFETNADIQYSEEYGHPKLSREELKKAQKEAKIYVSKLELMLNNL